MCSPESGLATCAPLEGGAVGAKRRLRGWSTGEVWRQGGSGLEHDIRASRYPLRARSSLLLAPAPAPPFWGANHDFAFG